MRSITGRRIAPALRLVSCAVFLYLSCGKEILQLIIDLEYDVLHLVRYPVCRSYLRLLVKPLQLIQKYGCKKTQHVKVHKEKAIADAFERI